MTFQSKVDTRMRTQGEIYRDTKCRPKMPLGVVIALIVCGVVLVGLIFLGLYQLVLFTTKTYGLLGPFAFLAILYGFTGPFLLLEEKHTFKYLNGVIVIYERRER